VRGEGILNFPTAPKKTGSQSKPLRKKARAVGTVRWTVVGIGRRGGESMVRPGDLPPQDWKTKPSKKKKKKSERCWKQWERGGKKKERPEKSVTDKEEESTRKNIKRTWDGMKKNGCGGHIV